MGCKQLSYYQEPAFVEEQSFVAVHHGEKTKTLKKCFDPYLYELKDHLGNVRTLISDAKQQHTQDGKTAYRPTIVKASTYYPFGMDRTPVVWDEVQYLATLESERQATEQSEFANYDQLDKISTALYNHTPGGSKSLRLTGKTGKSIGLAKTLKVQAGDKITAEVYGKYVTLSRPSPTAIAKYLATDLITAFNLPTKVVDGRLIRDAFRSTFSSGSFFAFAKNKDKVRATLSYLLFDDQHVLKASGFKSLSEAAHGTGAGTPHELLSQVIIPEQDGYLYLYLSNESLQTNEVYFDDFEITHELIMEDPQLQAFRYGFNGKERDENGEWGGIVGSSKPSTAGGSPSSGGGPPSGGGPGGGGDPDQPKPPTYHRLFYDYGFRIYSADLGRFLSVDPLADQFPAWSTFNFVLGNPINLIDPDGRAPKPLDDYTIKQDGSIEVVKTDDNFDRFFIENKQGNTEFIGQFNKNENNLIQLPSNFDFNSEDPNSSFSIRIKPGQEPRSYLSGKSIATLFGAASDANVSDLTITRGSHPDGRSPGNSTSHVNGINFDMRFLRIDKSGGPLDISKTPDLLDVPRQNAFNDALFKFGYKDLIGFRFERNKKIQLLNHTRHLKHHHHHIHLQGFRPKLNVVKRK